MGTNIKLIFRLLALVIVIAAAAFWLAAGANRGWSKTSVATKTVDQVTGIEAIEYQNKFVPGVDFLGAAAFSAAMLALVAFFFNTKTKPIKTQP